MRRQGTRRVVFFAEVVGSSLPKEAPQKNDRNYPGRVPPREVIPERFERSTHSLEGCCSIQLSYGTVAASLRRVAGAKVRKKSEK